MGMKYFTNGVDYPNILGGDILPDGTLWSYVSSTFLNGFINYAQPIKCYLMNRYRDWNEEREDDDLKLQHRQPMENKWVDHVFKTKEEIYQFVLKNPTGYIHSRLDVFSDDILVLSKVKDTPNKYIFFWFDRDVSDCCIGVFTTEDTEETVVNEFRSYVQEIGAELQRDYLRKTDGCSAAELPLGMFQGWVKF